MKVLHVITGIDCGGAENHLLDVGRHQRVAGIVVTMAYLRGKRYWTAAFEALGADMDAQGLGLYDDFETCDRAVLLAPIEQWGSKQSLTRCVRIFPAALCWMKRGCVLRTFLTHPRLLSRWRDHRSGRADWVSSLWSVLMFQAWLDQNSCAN